ncbi:DinB family protein [Rudanella paleaurantiibacter]|uniref:DinB family protein n=1 Tax=Rudanella paleaurantiibacter TaxID=2614655 RepID=A0A7J5U014_9BACT|nr:DinB family protein [Rudanella paleaurantiibacter]KAB7731009.1 DinB family protein [Rudanella paleaurantiibacter]
MKRKTFLKRAAGLAGLPVVSLPGANPEADRIRQELLDAWRASEKISIATAEQMPDAGYAFRYTPEAMTFAEQWRHCLLYTVGQLQADFEQPNLYAGKRLPLNMTKAEVMAELPRMYAHVRRAIETIPAEKLLATVEYGEHKIPGWRLLYVLENHIIHHRGQCVVYLRLKGITPESYYGW